jgi:hypothetical protein
MPYSPASFPSFSDAEWENAQSRIYLGIHWHFDAVEGIKQGIHVADYVFSQPSSQSSKRVHEKKGTCRHDLRLNLF